MSEEDRLRRYAERLEKIVQERTEDVRRLNETITERLIQKINQIDHISEIRERLKKSSSLDSNLETIFDGALEDLNMDVAAIFIVNRESQTVEVKAFKSKANVDIGKAYRLNRPFIEYECIDNNAGISRIVKEQSSILGTKSVSCAPITFRNQVMGFFAVGSMREETLDESDLSVLRLYSGLVTTIFETASLTVEPIRESIETKQTKKYTLNSGSSYVVEDNVDLAYDIFTNSIMSGVEGLCITRILPEKIRRKYGLKKTPIVWLTSESVKDERAINNLQDLSILISNYVEKAEKPIILIDGIEYLTSSYGFNSVYQFLQSKRSQIESSDGTLIIPFFKDAFEPKETRLIEREFEQFKPR
jgi:hypothetical protein